MRYGWTRVIPLSKNEQEYLHGQCCPLPHPTILVEVGSEWTCTCGTVWTWRGNGEWQGKHPGGRRGRKNW